MKNKIGLIVFVVIFLGGIAFAKPKMTKTDEGFIIEDIHTYYTGSIKFGTGFTDHKKADPLYNFYVVAYGNGWMYSTTADENGTFKVEVKPNVKFRLKASDGNEWYEAEDELAAVPEGTIGE